MSYKDTFGLNMTYGREEGLDKYLVASVTEFGGYHQLVAHWDFDKTGVPSADVLTIANAKIPAGSCIVYADLIVNKAAATPGTTLDVGTYKLDGTAIDADGIVAAEGLSAGYKEGAGALIGTVVAEDSYIKFTPSAATAAALGGLKATLIVEYV